MFSLYVNKEKMELVIAKNTLTDNITEDIVQYNSCYFIGPDRKKLKEFAEELRVEWIREAETRLEVLKSLKIKNKY